MNFYQVLGLQHSFNSSLTSHHLILLLTLLYIASRQVNTKERSTLTSMGEKMKKPPNTRRKEGRKEGKESVKLLVNANMEMKIKLPQHKNAQT